MNKENAVRQTEFGFLHDKYTLTYYLFDCMLYVLLNELGETTMATLNQIKKQMNMGDRYLFDGTLFRDCKRDTATLYIEITDTHTSQTTDKIRIGFKEFENTETQYQTQCVVKQTGEHISGIQAEIFVPYKEQQTYQINIKLNDELYVLHWEREYNPNNDNIVASSTARTTPFEQLFGRKTQSNHGNNNSKLVEFVNSLSD